jgi:CHAT domain-containing protein
MRVRAQSDSASLDAHTAGVWDLIWGRIDEAVVDLREAVRHEPLNARAFNDLAVSLTGFAEHHDDPSALVDAFVAADSAVRIDSTLKEARFTHALLLERLFLRTDAIDAWNRYLRLDGRSRWADEAREHLASLQPKAQKIKQNQERLRRALAVSDTTTIRSIVADNPSDVRIIMVTQLGDWGATFDRDSARARADLDFARAIAGPLQAATGDALVADAIVVIDRALAERDTTRTRALAQGHASLAKGIDLFNGPGPRKATAEFLNARKLLATGASPMGGWALLYAARAQILVLPDTALAWLIAIRDSAPPRYPTLRSVAAQYKGFLYDLRADHMHMIAAYDSAVSENQRTREPGVALRAGSWLAEAEDALRGEKAAWRTRYATLAATPRYPLSYREKYTVFDYAGKATANDAPRLSLRYCDESVRIAGQMQDIAILTYALRRRAELWAGIGQSKRAAADIAAAFNAANREPDSARRKALTTDLALSSARIKLSSEPTAASADLRSVIEVYKATKYAKGLSSAYLYLAQSRAATGAIDSARSAFDSATALMQRERASIAAYTERASFLDAARSVIDQTVAFHADHDARSAFEYFEGNRARVLLDQLANAHGQAAEQRPVLAALQNRLTKNDIVISYAVLPRELLVWIITRKRFVQHRVQVSASELEDLVDRFHQSLLNESGQPDAVVSERLYRMLADSANRLQPGANLIVIPDRWLHFVPFVALRDPSTGRFLVRDHAVSYAPNATLLLSSLAHPRQRFSRSARVLAIGNPAFDQRAFQLPPIPASEVEARRIASLYADQNLLTGRDATDTALERMAPNFDILHFAGHAVVARDVRLSHLVLASDGRSDGAVFSTDIAQWNLSRTRLVILSGCNTADGTLSATEGASSLARAFFAAGVRSVVSSLWAIDDEDTADFFIAFHRRLAEGDSPSVALRETQIEWLGDQRAPAHPVRSWAAFQLFGGW